jgi:hypothetical protein
MRRIYLDSALIIWLAEQTTHAEMYQMPPSLRFPPLREGNRAGVRFPLFREGNRAGVRFSLFRERNHAGVWFPLLAGGTLRRGSWFTLVLQITKSLRVSFAPCPLPNPLLRVQRLGSLCERRSRFSALTPSPSPTGWARGVGAHGSAPRGFHPRPCAGEEEAEGEGDQVRLSNGNCAGKIVPALREGWGGGLMLEPRCIDTCYCA